MGSAAILNPVIPSEARDLAEMQVIAKEGQIPRFARNDKPGYYPA
jgi:hypothetical protein